MRILFLVRHYTYLRNFESAVLELTRRGHDVHVSADKWELLGGEQLVRRLAAESGGRLTFGWTKGRGPGAWTELARRLRLALDYLRFVDPLYDDTPHLRARARERAPHIVLRLRRLPGLGGVDGARRIERWLRFLEGAVPGSVPLEAFLREQRPDAVLITPLIELGAPQLDHLVASKALGLRSVLAVGSWDHLSSKSRLRELPELVMVWNPVQREEARRFHGVPDERIVVTGAQCFDKWFDRTPSRTREAFLDRVGLPRDRPFLLYVCSSLFRGTGNEARFVEQWIREVRSSADPALRDAAILVRPHPQRMDEWASTDLTGYRDVAFYGAHPIDAESQSDYFDSMYHAAAVIGLNTSAFIEAACVDKPVLAVLLPEFSERNQEGTLHFRYLLEVNGGLLHAARSFDEHRDQLARALAGARSEKSRRFVEGFVRPFGRSDAGTPRFADAIEALGARPAPAPVRASTGAIVVSRMILLPWLLVAGAQVWSELGRKMTRSFVQRTKRRVIERACAPLRRRLLERLGAASPPPLQGTLLPKVGKGADPAKVEKFPNVPEVQEVRALVTAIGRISEPIIAGPWVSETGFELLYWIPFLNWARAYGNIDADRLVVISRGGPASWYRHITNRYVDIFDYCTPDEFRAMNDARQQQHGGRLKHLEMSTWDREIERRVAGDLALGKTHRLHPSTMYRLFNAYWRQLAPVTLIDAFTAHGPLPKADRPDVRAALPARYVAAKFYANGALPDTVENRRFITETLRSLTETTDVVLLDTGVRFDDHADLPSEVRGRVHRIADLMRPQDNLEVQSAVIAGADAFVGTYGGFSYLAPLLGVPTVAFYSHPTGFRFDHLDVARRVFSALQLGAFVPLDLREVPVTRLALAAGGALAAAAAPGATGLKGALR
jgi:hypothetical protein